MVAKSYQLGNRDISSDVVTCRIGCGFLQVRATVQPTHDTLLALNRRLKRYRSLAYAAELLHVLTAF